MFKNFYTFQVQTKKVDTFDFKTHDKSQKFVLLLEKRISNCLKFGAIDFKQKINFFYCYSLSSPFTYNIG